MAGVQSPDFENAPPCHRASHPAYTCDDAAADRARVIVTHMVLHRTLTCQPVGRSYARIVATCTFADGRDLSCAVLAAGAAVVWETYWRRYGMGECVE